MGLKNKKARKTLGLVIAGIFLVVLFKPGQDFFKSGQVCNRICIGTVWAALLAIDGKEEHTECG